MELTEENYFDADNMKKYLSVSQIKQFIGCGFIQGCEARAMAELNGEYEREKTDSLLIGSYVDIALTGTDEEMEKYKADNPQIFSSRGETKGQLKSQYLNAEKMIERVKSSDFMMKTLNGQHQVIMVGELFGVPTKIKIDNLTDKAIVDLKTCESLTKGYYDPTQKKSVSFITHMDYVLQGAVYQEIVKQNTKKTLPFFLTCVSKEKVPDIGVYQIDNESLHDRLFGNADLGIPSLEESIQRIDALKKGKIEPLRCENCEYCRKTKVLTKPLNWLDILGEVGAE